MGEKEYSNSLSTVLLVSTYPRYSQCMVYTYLHERLIFIYLYGKMVNEYVNTVDVSDIR